MVQVVRYTRDELIQKRDELLAEAGLDFPTLRERYDYDMLSPEQIDIYWEVKGLEFLLRA